MNLVSLSWIFLISVYANKTNLILKIGSFIKLKKHGSPVICL